MNTKSILIVTALALAAGNALAEGASNQSTPLTRAEVRQAVVAARDAGQLIPAGEGQPRLSAELGKSTLTRADVRRDVVVAARAGQLTPAGEGELRVPFPVYAGEIQLARSDVKAETLRARDAGELIPAGESGYGSGRAHALASTPFSVASVPSELASLSSVAMTRSGEVLASIGIPQSDQLRRMLLHPQGLQSLTR